MCAGNSAIAAVFLVRPVFGQWFGPYATWAIAGVEGLTLLAYLFCLRLSVSDTTELERLIGLAVVDALERCGLPMKAAAAVMAVDESHLRQALKHEAGRHLSIYRLARLPLNFWLHFMPTLSALVVKQHMTHLIEDLGFRKSA